MPATSAHRAIDAIWRIESPRLVAGLTRMVRDVALAEDLAQDALVAALEAWPRTGVPDNPGAWLATTAKRRAIDALRHRETADGRHAELAHRLARGAPASDPELEAVHEGDVGDDLLRLIFLTCHPILPTESRIALTLPTTTTRLSIVFVSAFAAARSSSPTICGTVAVTAGR